MLRFNKKTQQKVEGTIDVDDFWVFFIVEIAELF